MTISKYQTRSSIIDDSRVICRTLSDVFILSNDKTFWSKGGPVSHSLGKIFEVDSRVFEINQNELYSWSNELESVLVSTLDISFPSEILHSCQNKKNVYFISDYKLYVLSLVTSNIQKILDLEPLEGFECFSMVYVDDKILLSCSKNENDSRVDKILAIDPLHKSLKPVKKLEGPGNLSPLKLVSASSLDSLLLFRGELLLTSIEFDELIPLNIEEYSLNYQVFIGFGVYAFIDSSGKLQKICHITQSDKKLEFSSAVPFLSDKVKQDIQREYEIRSPQIMSLKTNDHIPDKDFNDLSIVQIYDPGNRTRIFGVTVRNGPITPPNYKKDPEIEIPGSPNKPLVQLYD